MLCLIFRRECIQLYAFYRSLVQLNGALWKAQRYLLKFDVCQNCALVHYLTKYTSFGKPDMVMKKKCNLRALLWTVHRHPKVTRRWSDFCICSFLMKSLRGHMKGGGAEQGSMCDSADAKVIDNPPRQAELRLNLVSSSCIMPGCHGYPSSSYKEIRGVGRGCVGGHFLLLHILWHAVAELSWGVESGECWPACQTLNIREKINKK